MQATENSKLEKFLCKYDIGAQRIEQLRGDASSRNYYRIHCTNESDGVKSYILMDSFKDQNALVKTLRVTRTFRRLGVNVPQVFHYDLDFGYALIEDFGHLVLNNVINASNKTSYYKTLLDTIASIQYKTLNNKEIELSEYNESFLDKEILQFCKHYLKYHFIEAQLEHVTCELFEALHALYSNLGSVGKVLVHRDFHVDNLLLKPNNTIGIIDHQDAVLGSAAYDVASLLQDARREVPRKFEQEMLQYFLAKTGYNSKLFMLEYNILALQKNLKIVGIFHRLNRENSGTEYLKRCSLVWQYIERTLENSGAEMQELCNWFEKYNILKQAKNSI